MINIVLSSKPKIVCIKIAPTLRNKPIFKIPPRHNKTAPSIRTSLPNLKLWQHTKNGHWFTPISSTKYPYKFSDPLVNQIEHFCDVIQKKKKPIITASIANETIKVIEAIKLSSKTKKLVELKH